MTNGPFFPWHLTNLQNYTFSNVDKDTAQLGKLTIATQDGGIALSALPSAETSQGRLRLEMTSRRPERQSLGKLT